MTESKNEKNNANETKQDIRPPQKNHTEHIASWPQWKRDGTMYCSMK